jgi:hypothetical protein
LGDASEVDVEMVRRPDGAWFLDANDFGRVRTALGADLLLAFTQCFVHENRLLTFAHYRSLIRTHARQKVVSVERTKSTILWFEIGTILELEHAITRLRIALRKRGWLDARGFDALNEIATRWKRDLRKHRNRAAFHVDPDVVAAGLARIPDEPLTLMIGDGPGHDETWIAIADRALMGGIVASQAEGDELVRTVVRDREAVLLGLLHVFTDCVLRAGLTFRETRTE